MAKGGNFERDVCKYLSKWLTGSEKPYQYWRMPGSGSLCTIHEEMEHMSGDIRAITKEAKFLTECFSIECKTGYPKTSFWQHFNNPKINNIRDFWIQCIRDADKSNKNPMLIYRKKGKKSIVGVCCNMEYEIYKHIEPNMNTITLDFSNELNIRSVTFFDMNQFFETVTPDLMKKIIYSHDMEID